MSQPANDVFSQHLSDDEASYHEDASDNAFTISSSEGRIGNMTDSNNYSPHLEAHVAKKYQHEDSNHKFPDLSPSLVKTGNDNEEQHKSSTNKVKSGHTGAYSTYTPSTSSNNIPEREVPAGFADEVIYITLCQHNQKSWTCLHEDLEHIDDLDIEELDLNFRLAMSC
ncbi:hypothetical protein Tco_1405281 [Tanacetum coccineum]